MTSRSDGCHAGAGTVSAPKKDGGYAFPVSFGPDGTPGYGAGMTLRDYFAAHSQAEFVVTGPLSDADIEEIAAYAARVRFAVADAMLRERDR